MSSVTSIPTAADLASWIPAHLTQDEPIPGWLREITVANFVDVSLATLRRWDRQRVGPVRTKIGKAVYYRQESLYAWLLAQEKAQPQRAA